MIRKHKVEINLDSVLETLRRGVRRADVFMGMGLNAAEQNPPPSHILAPETGFKIQLVKQDLTKQEKAHIASEFGKWVQANGLRDLMETFSIFMHTLYTVNFMLLNSLGKIDDLASIPPPRFEKMGIGEQIDTLAKVVTVSADDFRITRSLNQTRNCYAHRRGIIGDIDIDHTTNVFELLWAAFQIEIAEPNGNLILEPEIYGRVFENGGTVQLRMVMRSKQFRRGEELVVSKKDLKEICFCVLSIGERLFSETIRLAREEGVLAEKGGNNLRDSKPV